MEPDQSLLSALLGGVFACVIGGIVIGLIGLAVLFATGGENCIGPDGVQVNDPADCR